MMQLFDNEVLKWKTKKQNGSVSGEMIFLKVFAVLRTHKVEHRKLDVMIIALSSALITQKNFLKNCQIRYASHWALFHP